MISRYMYVYIAASRKISQDTIDAKMDGEKKNKIEKNLPCADNFVTTLVDLTSATIAFVVVVLDTCVCFLFLNPYTRADSFCCWGEY